MTTRRKSEFSKARGDIRRAIGHMVQALPSVARVNWRNIVMPWRLIPMPVAMALIALVALAMVLDTDSDASAQPEALEGQSVMIGSDTVAPGTRCQEDEVITYRALLGGQGVGCVHYEYLIMDFITDCLIGNSDHGDNLASQHLRDQTFRSWCDGVVDDASEGMVTLVDWLIDTATTSETAIMPTAIPPSGEMAISTPALPSTLPNAGSQ